MKKTKHIYFDFRPSERLEKIILFGPFVLAGLAFLACLFVELTHMNLSHETRGLIYIRFGDATYYFSIFLCVLYGRKYGLGWIRSIIYTAASFLLIFSLASQIWSNIDVAIFNVGSIASFRSLLLMPLLGMVLSLFDKRGALTICDYLTPYYLFQHGMTTHGCWISGCCGGKPMSWGIVNPDTGLSTFPAQPYAIILALGIALWGLLYAKKKGYQTHGKVFAISTIVYGTFRFVMEFFTDDRRALGPLSIYSIYAFLMILLGILVYFGIPKSPVDTIKINTVNNVSKLMED